MHIHSGHTNFLRYDMTPSSLDDLNLWPTVRLLGYGGWLPFYGLLGAGWLWPEAAWPHSLMLAYGVAIVSFVGAISWGWALAWPNADRVLRIQLLAWGVMPALLACVAVLLPGTWVWWALLLVYACAWAVDRSVALRLQLPPAWMRMRTHLSLGVGLALVLAAFTF